MSLFAVGGAAAAVPEMHRIAVELHHWMTDKQFADAYAIAQLSPPESRRAGDVLPTALLAYHVSRLLNRPSNCCTAPDRNGCGDRIDLAH